MKKTYELINRDFWWSSMAANVTEFVTSCDICQRAKSSHHAPYGLLQPLLVMECPWQGVSMDFITDLPVVEGFDSICTIVDRFSKMCHLVPCTKTIDAPATARLFFRNMVCLHGFPENVVSDRGAQFVSNF